ncbi:MORN repeat-containing protein 3 isoform X2 [Aethina tumida]|uniref:MORN repeat-containing protein 3 isoform X2 n=1 Tax=Aethina tumida TaxID=116153 RepID=UPI00096B2255|nr:MORN repeat-containing protein 3 isoform X2 [Aethina tumida]XP_049824102.1 MORN repeat-containing protein 3 isoform X2 [Aethina tumida]
MPFLKSHVKLIPRSRLIERTTYRDGLRHAIFTAIGDQKYIGDWRTDVKCGKGVLWHRDQKVYEGDFKDNLRHGFGVLARRIPDCNVYTLEYRGDWRYGKMEGNGLRVYKDGSFYKGEFLRGKRHGYGQMWYADHSFYDGEWVKDLRQGEGMYVYPNGNRYEGQWNLDVKHGKGEYFHLDSGQLQEGLWKEDHCLTSTLRDIPYRQTSSYPTPFPIRNAEIKNADKFARHMMRILKIKTLQGVCGETNAGYADETNSSSSSDLSNDLEVYCELYDSQS